jgi:hypothetical protein
MGKVPFIKNDSGYGGHSAGGAGVLQVSKELASNLQKHLAAGLP